MFSMLAFIEIIKICLTTNELEKTKIPDSQRDVPESQSFFCEVYVDEQTLKIIKYNINITYNKSREKRYSTQHYPNPGL